MSGSTSNFDSDVDSFDSSATSARSGGVGLSDIQLSGTRRQMLDLVNRLHSTGVQIDIDLPQIAVIGSQSAGKSSLIESISGITLPRAAGTCTRCPTECRLSYSPDAWKCIVSLRLNDAGRIRNEHFGKPIFQKQEVEDRIRRAQRAVLNPKLLKAHGPEYFLGNEVDEDRELSFSADFVSLQISGPDVADLSFCDLPGLIANAGSDGNLGDIDLVKALVTSYIKRENCIILLTVTCETDIQNQGAQTIAREYDPDGKRTIGVLTKPDRIPPGEENNWVSMIKNEHEPLENGWYCVKQPSSQEIKEGITWGQARRREQEFFDSRDPWRGLNSDHKNHLRTHNLVERLSLILSDLIATRLPGIQNELEQAIQRTRDEIAKLPHPPSNDPFNDILNLLHYFVHDLSRLVEGIPVKDGLLQTIRPEQQRFRRAIRATAPVFIPIEKGRAFGKVVPKPTFLDFEEEADVTEEELYEPSLDGRSVDGDFQAGGPIAPSSAEPSHPAPQVARLSSPQPPRPAPQAARLSSLQPPRPAPQPSSVESFHPTAELTELPPPGSFYIDEVLERAHQARTRELPGHFPFVVQKNFIKLFTKQWDDPARQLCKAVYGVLNQQVKDLVHEHFHAFGHGQLEQRVKVLVHEHLNKCLQEAEARIDWLMKLEADPFTLNTHYLGDYREKFLIHYASARARDRNLTLINAIDSQKRGAPVIPSYGISKSANDQLYGIPKVLSGLAEIGLHGVKAEALAKLLPPDGSEAALGIMADVRAYFQVAYKRFVDNVPLAIDYELIRGAERDMQQVLNKGLKISTPEGHQICRDLAQERPSVASRRQELEKKLERMQAASEQLLSL